MKKIIGVFIFVFSLNVFSASPNVDTCKIFAQKAKTYVEYKNSGSTESQIRELIFKKNSDLKKEKNKYISVEDIDLITEGEIEYLIWIFDKKNSGLSPDQVYSIKFNECFKYLKSK